MTDTGTTLLNERSYDRPQLGWLTRGVQLTFIAAVLVITYNSLIPTHPSDAPKYFDKVMHLGAYFVLTGLFAFAFPRTKLLTIFLVVSIYGAGIEVLQGTLAEGRTASLADLLANLIGAALAIGICAWIASQQKNQTLNS